jgi:type IV secretory pathway VirB3-like protein
MLLAIAAAAVSRIDIPASYHAFADQRSWFLVPNFGDVVSNLPFAIVGVWGLVFTFFSCPPETFEDSRERWPYVFIFLGLLLTAFGSAYYHLAPTDDRLMWDRLPMTIVFMVLVAALIAERISLKAGLFLLPVLLGLGVWSVAQWHLSVVRGHGDIRFYAAVQIYAGLVLLVMLLLPVRYSGGWGLAVIAAFYALAKLLEMNDKRIFQLGRAVSGHTLKHLAAGAAGYWILHMLRTRQRIGETA